MNPINSISHCLDCVVSICVCSVISRRIWQVQQRKDETVCLSCVVWVWHCLYNEPSVYQQDMVSVPHLLWIRVAVSFPGVWESDKASIFSWEDTSLVVGGVQLRQVTVSPLCIESDLIITCMANMKACKEWESQSKAKSLWLIRVIKHSKDTSVLVLSMIWIEWTETVSWIWACLYMCMNHVCPSSSYVTTVEELQSYNDQASQEMWCDIGYVKLCDLFCPKLTVCYSWKYVSILWAILTDNLFVWNAGWISYVLVSMTVKFEGTVSGIP